MNHLIIHSLLLSLIPFAISLFIDVCLGFPGSNNFNEKAIFAGYPVWLAERKLKKFGMWRDLYRAFHDNLNSPNQMIRNVAKSAYKKQVFETGKLYFGFEYGVGICTYCTNARIAIVFALSIVLYYKISFVYIPLTMIFSNLYLLFFNQLKN